MLAHERSGPTGTGLAPILLIHAGIADRRMWDPIWSTLTATRDVVRIDLRGYGESTARPDGPWSPRADVIATLDHLEIDRAHVVGCSFGAGVAIEVALERPATVRSLVLAAPGGSLLTEESDELMAFVATEGRALAAGDLDAAVEANLAAWVDGPHRGPDVVAATVRDAVRTMQRHAFEITAGWPEDVWASEDELDPIAPERLSEIGVPSLVISGGLDIDSVLLAADALLAGLHDVRGVVWDDVAHLPSMERPDDFADQVLAWVADAER
ncbi:alpha/beta hydrolase [Sanguibacter sp. 25GB23B1]|uniref:alpha/beta fold hydrolase n=1 Tax=unclassified Sanguibacter TaxID=2645534 RepID=UPI0032AF7862